MKPASALLVALLAVAAIAAVPPGGASHDASANYTVTPMDRSPGATGVSYKQFAVADTHVAEIDYLVGRYAAGSFGGCGSTNSDTFGIDRDDDASGTTVDENLKDNVESVTTTEHTFIADMYDSDDAVGSTTFIEPGDEFVSYTTDCFTNPDEPGWYQFYSKTNGTTDGEQVRTEGYSHYFYICDCASEAEARERLGPPPSEESATPTPTATPSATPTATADPTPTRTPPADGTPFPSPTPTPTPASTATATSTPTASGTPTGQPAGAEPGAGGGDGGAADATPTAAGWEGTYPNTPTVAEGSGFGPGAALLAVLVAAVLAVRRRR